MQLTNLKQKSSIKKQNIQVFCLKQFLDKILVINKSPSHVQYT